MSYTSPDATGSIRFQPVADANGSTPVTVTVTDGAGTSASRSFTVNVLPVNDAPSFTAGNPPAANEDAGPQTVANWAAFSPGPANESNQTVLGYTVTGVSNPALFAVPPRVANNGALLLHEHGLPLDEVRDYVRRWSLRSDDQIAKGLQFITDETWRAYVSCYSEGLALARRFLAREGDGFRRLLTEQLLPADLAGA